MENWDTHFQTLYHCQGPALEGELSSLLCHCSAAGRSCICFGDLYIWKRWKMCFHHYSHFFPGTTSNTIPSCHAICIPSPSCVGLTIHHICRAMGLPDQFWLLLISNFLPMLCCPSPGGWNLTCSRVSHQRAKPIWNGSSCPAGSRERSGTHSRNWFWPPWCR